MKGYFRKIVATGALTALLLSLSVMLFSVPITSAAVGDSICEPSEIDTAFDAINLVNEIYTNKDIDFTWAHDVDGGDCDDVDFEIRVLNANTLQVVPNASVIIIQDGIEDETFEEYTYDISNLPDGEYLFRLRIVGNSGNVGDAVPVIIDTTRPTIETAYTFEDLNPDGTVDFIEVQFDETIDTNLLNLDGISLSDNITISSFEEVDSVTIQLNLDAAPEGDTGITPTISGSANNIRDLAGNTLDLGDGYTSTDGARPIPRFGATTDRDLDGFVDAVVLTFTEPVERADEDYISLDGTDFISFSYNNGIEEIGLAENLINTPIATKIQLNEIEFLSVDECFDPELFNLLPQFALDLAPNQVCATLSYNTENIDYNTEFAFTSNLYGLFEDLAGNRFASELDNILGFDRASIAIVDAETRDLDQNGLIDAVKVYFSEPILDNSVTVEDFVVTSGELEWTPSVFDYLSVCEVDDTQDRPNNSEYICLEITENSELPEGIYGDTGLTPSIAIDGDFPSIPTTDTNSNFTIPQTFSDTRDGAAPVVTSAYTRDLGSPLEVSPWIDLDTAFNETNNGKIDAVELRFSEEIQDDTINYGDIIGPNNLVTGYSIRLGVLNFEDLNCAIENPNLERDPDSNYLCIPLEEIEEGYDTGVEPLISGPAALYQDLVGNESAQQINFQTTDGARPLIIDVETKDINQNLDDEVPGKLDAVKIFFSEEFNDDTIVETDFAIQGYQVVAESFIPTNSCGSLDEPLPARDPNSNYICLGIQEIDTPFSATFTGDTSATPVVEIAVDRGLNSDLESNVFYGHKNLGNEGGAATDTAGPAITFARSLTTNTVEVFYSENVLEGSVAAGDIYFDGSDEDAFAAVSINPIADNNGDELIIYTTPATFSSNYRTGTVQLNGLTAVSDTAAAPNLSSSNNPVNIVDNIDPVIDLITLTSTSTTLSVGSTATLTVDTDDNDYCGLGTTCVVTVNGVDVTATLAVDEEDDTQYRFTYTANGSHQERSAGTIPVSVTFQDQALNTTTSTAVTANTLAIDFPNRSSGGGGGGGSSRDNDEDSTPTAPSPATSGFPFVDTTSHWSKEFVETLYKDGVINGKSANTFGPDDQLTRAEITKIALLAFDYEVGTSTNAGFSDVEAGSWYATFVTSAKAAGIVSGYSDGTFKPNAPVTRAEALKILLTAAKLSVAGAPNSSFTDVDQAAWYADFVDFAFDKKIVSGLTPTTFGPDEFVTRGQVAKMAVLTLQAK